VHQHGSAVAVRVLEPDHYLLLKDGSQTAEDLQVAVARCVNEPNAVRPLDFGLQDGGYTGCPVQEPSLVHCTKVAGDATVATASQLVVDAADHLGVP
jgi:uncharacterized protein (UPF0212 family)